VPEWLQEEVETLKKYLVLILVVLTSVFVISSTRAAGVPDEQFTPTNQTGANLGGVWFDDNIDTTRMPSLMYGSKYENGIPPKAIDFCDSLQDIKCSTADIVNYFAILPKCATNTDIDCINSFYAVTSDRKRVDANFVRMMPGTVAKQFSGNPTIGLASGSNAGIWSLSGINHSGGNDTYAVIVTRYGTFQKNSSQRFQSTGFGDFRAGIYPVNIESDPAYAENQAVINYQASSNTTGLGISHPSRLDFRPCAIVANGECALRESFPPNIRFGISIRLSTALRGWMHGRVENPDITYTKTSTGSQVDVVGLPVAVPTVAGWTDMSSLTASQTSELGFGSSGGRSGSQLNPTLSGEQAMKMMTAWNRILGDKAVVEPTQWIVHSLGENEMFSANSCITNSKSLAGIVSTNSTTYSAGPPTYNSVDQTLDYKVASPHLIKSGEIFQGSYDLYIDESVARCIYGFSSAPIAATVSVLNSSGSAQLVTTSLTKNAGWLHLSAKGFTFSNPTIKVKLTQDAPVVVAPAPAPSVNPSTPTANAAKPTVKQSTVTCVKGKTTKKVTATKPACPSGFKKK